MGAGGTNEKIRSMKEIDKMFKIAPVGFCLLLLCCVLIQRSGICIVPRLLFRFIVTCYLCFPFFNQNMTFGTMKQRSEASKCTRGKTSDGKYIKEHFLVFFLTDGYQRKADL